MLIPGRPPRSFFQKVMQAMDVLGISVGYTVYPPIEIETHLSRAYSSVCSIGSSGISTLPLMGCFSFTGVPPEYPSTCTHVGEERLREAKFLEFLRECDNEPRI